ncbi:MAG: DUF3833 family protein [bacterium]
MRGARLRFGAALMLAALLSACLRSLPARPPVQPQPVFDPIAFFSGHTRGEGTLDVRFGKARSLTVDGMGRTNADGTFTLDQTVTYGDGAVETRRWVLRRTDATHYSATLSDATGDVAAESEGTLFHLRYRIRSPHVYMEQWLYLQPDGRSVLNQAEVSVLGVSWARLSETITRVDTP